MDFSNQLVVITGAGSGIGRATALKLASLGANLALCDINVDTVLSVQIECTARIQIPAQRHMAQRLDVRSGEDVQQFVDKVAGEYGRINHVFNCAGVNPTRMNIEDVSDEYWDAMFNANVKAVFAVTTACLPHMSSGSSFVNVSSYCGLYPVSQYAVYCATKYAVVGFSKCLALELGPKGIRVNVIAPGTIDTPTNISVRAGGDAAKQIAGTIGLRRVGTAEEVADVVAFLFSTASAFMNGSVVEVDGGLGVAG